MGIMTESGGTLNFSGERFRAVYHLSGDAGKAEAMSRDICIEQTVEFPQDLIQRSDIRDRVFGRVESFRSLSPTRHEAVISFAVEIVGNELTQLLNVVFGNISLKPGIRLENLEFPESLLSLFPGPRYGRSGLRQLTGIEKRPLLCTALKPMGLSPEELAELAYRFALGGIDMIKDDHGLADQEFCPFDKRVSLCAEAVKKANRETGGTCLYFPNITAPFHKIEKKARFARDAGAGGMMIAPGLTGFDTMRYLAANDGLALPVLSHPALLGSYSLRPDAGMGQGVLYGIFNRLAGADACIFPNYGGRFTFTQKDCNELVRGTQVPMGGLKPLFPMPAGGMSLDRVSELIDFYGGHMIMLIGGDLFRHGPDITANCRKFVQLAQRLY